MQKPYMSIQTDGKFFYQISEPTGSGFRVSTDVEIPDDVMKHWDEIKEDIEKIKVSLCKVETSHGKVYISIGEQDQIIIRYSDKTYETKNIYSTEGKRVICIHA